MRFYQRLKSEWPTVGYKQTKKAHQICGIFVIVLGEWFKKYF